MSKSKKRASAGMSPSKQRELYRTLSKFHQFTFKPSRSIKNPFTPAQKAAMTRINQKYGWLIEHVKSGEVKTYKAKSRKEFRDLAKGLPHTNKRFVFIRDPSAAHIKTFKDPETGRHELTWGSPIKTAGKIRFIKYSVIVPIPDYVYADYLLLMPWLRSLAKQFPANAIFSLIFGSTNYIPEPVDLAKAEHYANKTVNEIEDSEDEDEDGEARKLPYSAVKITWTERAK